MKNVSLLNDLTEYIGKYRGKDNEVSKELTKNLGKDVFIYGSTPYDTAKKLITSISKEPKRFVVVGTSIGWVNFYWNDIYPNIPTVGLDLHNFRVDYGNELIEKHNLSNIEIIVEDVYKFQFKEGDMVWLSNLCFDSKIVAEFMCDLIKSYKDISLISYRPIKCDGFRHRVKTYKLPASWMPEQPFFVYE
jgi:hypothetical protein